MLQLFANVREGCLSMNEKSEQIDTRLNIIVDDDQPLCPTKLDAIILSVLSSDKAKKNKVNIGDKRCPYISYFGSTSKHAILSAAVTFLGGHGNHPIFKKRIQLKSWFKPAHIELSKQGYIVHFLGVYYYNGNVVFVDFATDTYMQRKMHNSSAFVYVNDIFRAMKDGVATRIDFHGNKITTIRCNSFENYLNGYNISLSDSILFDTFNNFNKEMPFANWISGDSAIKEMHQNNWPKWRETEWPGWYLEFKFATYLEKSKSEAVVYLGNESKKKGNFDFDLLFPLHKFYGDLKASDIQKKVSPGNDKESIFATIDKCDRFWYVIYEHETVKDKDCGNPITKFRYEYLMSVDGSAKDPMSYATKMKNRVNFKRMMILELNRANCGDLLSDFHQGHQPDGSTRAVKVLIKKNNVENYQIFHYEV